jgi:hypothetical protein
MKFGRWRAYCTGSDITLRFFDLEFERLSVDIFVKQLPFEGYSRLLIKLLEV